MRLINKKDSSNFIKMSVTKKPNFNAGNSKVKMISKICIDFDVCPVYTNSKGTYMIVNIKNKWYRCLICNVSKIDINTSYTVKQERGYYKR